VKNEKRIMKNGKILMTLLIYPVFCNFTAHKSLSFRSEFPQNGNKSTESINEP